MPMHFAQARQQIFAATLEPLRSVLHSGAARRSYVSNSAITYYNRVIVQHPVPVHRNNVDADERKILRRGWSESNAKQQNHSNDTQIWFHGPSVETPT